MVWLTRVVSKGAWRLRFNTPRSSESLRYIMHSFIQVGLAAGAWRMAYGVWRMAYCSTAHRLEQHVQPESSGGRQSGGGKHHASKHTRTNSESGLCRYIATRIIDRIDAIDAIDATIKPATDAPLGTLHPASLHRESRTTWRSPPCPFRSQNPPHGP